MMGNTDWFPFVFRSSAFMLLAILLILGLFSSQSSSGFVSSWWRLAFEVVDVVLHSPHSAKPSEVGYSESVSGG